MGRNLDDIAAFVFIVMFGGGLGAAVAGAASISAYFLGIALILGGYFLYKRGV